MSTNQLRQELRANRRTITGSERRHLSEQIRDYLGRYLPFRRATSVGFYSSSPEEVDTEPAILLAEALGKTLYLPVINTAPWRQGRMLFALYIPGETPLKKNRYGIPEPDVRIGQCVRGSSLDLVCVPLVGFNNRCDRIGMGKGYFDETFSSPSFRKTLLAGLAYHCQRADFEPAPHDVPLDAVITETGIIERRYAHG